MSRELKFRYTFKRKEDGHIWQLIASLKGIEEQSGQLPSMLENELWELVARDQYARLKDKTGTEIYEGDIVRYSQWNTKDGMSPMGSSGWRVGDIYFAGGRFLVSGNELWDTLTYRNVEVIGNIYETPELLER